MSSADTRNADGSRTAADAHGRSTGGIMAARLDGPRTVIPAADPRFPQAFRHIPHPPQTLYVVGCADALQEGLAIVGARKATPYGRAAAKRFGMLAAQCGICVVSGGARGCDGEAHKGALEGGGKTVVFLGGGCDMIYPAQHFGLFQNIVNAGGAVVSEHPWEFPPKPYTFRARNRLIAGLSRATLIVEAGLPSGTFSTADEALAAGRDVLAVPGSITSATSRGANRLIYQGATPIVDDDSFFDAMFSLFGVLRQESFPEVDDAMRTEAAGTAGARDAGACGVGCADGGNGNPAGSFGPLVDALRAEPLGEAELYAIAVEECGSQDPLAWLSRNLLQAQRAGLVVSYPDGRYGSAVRV